MRIIIVGGTGTIGKAIANELKDRHELIIAAHTSGDVQVDIMNTDSITNMYKKIDNIGAVIAATGATKFAEFANMHDEDYHFGLNSKLMGQVNLVLIGREYLNDHGSFTLTSGILNRDPIVQGSSAAMVDGALDGFVKSAAIEMPRNMRINIVSPTLIKEAMVNYAPFFRGFKPVSAATAALAYSKSVEGKQTGQIYTVPNS